MTETKNLLQDLPVALKDELVEVLVASTSVRVERIVSTGHSSPAGFWYDQEESELVVLLKGDAKLLLEGEPNPRPMRPGDCINIPAHCKHRIESTSVTEPTVWLAVFYK